jgi:FixJ family two-component response regulator
VTIKAFVLDDDVTYLSILRDLFKQDGVTDCEFYSDPHQLLRDITENDYIFVLDFNLPGIDGLNVLVQVLLKNPDALVIMLTMNDDIKVVEDLLNYGAWKYHSKADELNAILETVKDVKHAQNVLQCTIKKKEACRWLKALTKP